MASNPYLYQSQGQAKTMPLPGGGGRGFGAETAAGIDALGRAAGQAADDQMRAREHELDAEAHIKQIDEERRIARETSEAAVAYAEMQGRIDVKDADLRASMPLGGDGYEEELFRYYDDERSAFTEKLTDQRLQDRFLPLLADSRGRLAVRARVAKIGAVADQAKLNAEQLTDVLSNKQRTNPDPSALTNSLALIDTFVEAQGGPEASRKAVRAEMRQKVIVGQVEGVMDANPQAALDLIAGGTLDVELGPEQLQVLRGHAESAINRLRVEAEREAAVSEKAQKEDEETLLGYAADGVQVDPGRLEAAAKNAEGRGDTSKAAELRQAATSTRVTNAYQNALPAQITSELAKIEADKNWQAKPEMVYRHTALEALRDRRRNDEPNIAPPNFSDAGDIQRYETAVRADAAARGTTPNYLSKDMVNRLQGELKAGTTGQARVLGLLAGFSPAASLAAARQIAPEDRVFQWAAALDDPQARSLAIAGRDAMAANDHLVPDKNMDRMFAQVETALSGFGADATRSAREAAASIAAELHRRQGKKAWDEKLAEEALHMALGGRTRGGERIGGVGKWGGAPVLLPDDMSQREFDDRLSRRSGPSTAFAGNRELSWAEVRKLRPVMVGDGVYQFHDAYGRPARFKDGSPAWWNARRTVVATGPQPKPKPAAPRTGQARSAYEALPARPLAVRRMASPYEVKTK